jgi:hypothetical protein
VIGGWSPRQYVNPSGKRVSVSNYDVDLQVLDPILEPMQLSYNLQAISSFCSDHRSSAYRNSHQLNTAQIPEMRVPSAHFPAPNIPNSNSQPKSHHPENTPNSPAQGADHTPARQMDTPTARRRNKVVGRHSGSAQTVDNPRESSKKTEMAAGTVLF